MKGILFIVFILLASLLSAQDAKFHWYIEPAEYVGYLIPIAKYIDYPVFVTDVRIGKQTTGQNRLAST